MNNYILIYKFNKFNKKNTECIINLKTTVMFKHIN